MEHVVLGAIHTVQHEGRVFEIVTTYFLHHWLQRLAVCAPGTAQCGHFDTWYNFNKNSSGSKLFKRGEIKLLATFIHAFTTYQGAWKNTKLFWVTWSITLHWKLKWVISETQINRQKSLELTVLLSAIHATVNINNLEKYTTKYTSMAYYLSWNWLPAMFSMYPFKEWSFSLSISATGSVSKRGDRVFCK